jgi:hypothetical protein
MLMVTSHQGSELYGSAPVCLQMLVQGACFIHEVSSHGTRYPWPDVCTIEVRPRNRFASFPHHYLVLQTRRPGLHMQALKGNDQTPNPDSNAEQKQNTIQERYVLD